jgi:DNA-binding GntR family transcriptional regulator
MAQNEHIDARHALEAELAIFLLAEEAIVAAAARNIDDPMKARLRHAIAFERRCAQVGDAEGMIAADAAVERLIFEAAGESEAAAELQSMKLKFKQAWTEAHRLRDMSRDADHREQQVASIIAGDEVGAVAAIRRFFADIRTRI